MTKQTSKEIKQEEQEIDEFVEEKLNEIFEEMEEKFTYEFHPYIFQNFAGLFIANAIANYMHITGLDKTNKEHQETMLEKAIESTKTAIRLAFESCDDCLRGMSGLH